MVRPISTGPGAGRGGEGEWFKGENAYANIVERPRPPRVKLKQIEKRYAAYEICYR